MIQDIGNHTYHVEYHPVPLARDGILLSYQGRKVLVRLTGDKEFVYPRHADYADIGEDQFRWLFAEDRAQFYLAKEALPERDGFTYVSINFMRAARPRYLACPCTTGTATTSIVAIAAAPWCTARTNAWYTATTATP